MRAARVCARTGVRDLPGRAAGLLASRLEGGVISARTALKQQLIDGSVIVFKEAKSRINAEAQPLRYPTHTDSALPFTASGPRSHTPLLCRHTPLSAPSLFQKTFLTGKKKQLMTHVLVFVNTSKNHQFFHCKNLYFLKNLQDLPKVK